MKMRSQPRLNTMSVSALLPISDGNYRGTWTVFRCTVQFEGFDVSFVTKSSIGVSPKKCEIEIIGGVAYVTAKGA